jgi:hypothetical protein
MSVCAPFLGPKKPLRAVLTSMEKQKSHADKNQHDMGGQLQ